MKTQDIIVAATRAQAHWRGPSIATCDLTEIVVRYLEELRDRSSRWNVLLRIGISVVAGELRKRWEKDCGS